METSQSAAPGDTALHHCPLHYRRVTADQRRDLIAEAAYHLAQARGFAPGHADEDWAAAEQQINRCFDGDYYCDG